MAIIVDKNKRVNYYLKSMDEVKRIQESNKKPSIAMHVCCGPCSLWPIEFLAKYFSKIIVLFDNSNIYPQSEYNRRLEELERYVDDFNNKFGNVVEIVYFPYDNEKYNQFLNQYGKEREGGERCQACYRKRMEETYKYAHEHNYDYYCTVMSISRQKSAQVLNLIGEELSHKYKPKYFYSDFKKQGGDVRRQELIKEYNMYNQNYCGCIYSYLEMMKKNKNE